MNRDDVQMAMDNNNLTDQRPYSSISEPSPYTTIDDYLTPTAILTSDDKEKHYEKPDYKHYENAENKPYEELRSQ